MTKRRLMSELDSRDIAEWLAFFEYERKDEERRKQKQEADQNNPKMLQAKLGAMMPSRRR